MQVDVIYDEAISSPAVSFSGVVVFLKQWVRDGKARDLAGGKVANLLFLLENGFARCGGSRLKDFLSYCLNFMKCSPFKIDFSLILTLTVLKETSLGQIGFRAFNMNQLLMLGQAVICFLFVM